MFNPLKYQGYFDCDIQELAYKKLAGLKRLILNGKRVNIWFFPEWVRDHLGGVICTECYKELPPSKRCTGCNAGGKGSGKQHATKQQRADDAAAAKRRRMEQQMRAAAAQSGAGSSTIVPHAN